MRASHGSAASVPARVECVSSVALPLRPIILYVCVSWARSASEIPASETHRSCSRLSRQMHSRRYNLRLHPRLTVSRERQTDSTGLQWLRVRLVFASAFKLSVSEMSF